MLSCKSRSGMQDIFPRKTNILLSQLYVGRRRSVAVSLRDVPAASERAGPWNPPGRFISTTISDSVVHVGQGLRHLWDTRSAIYIWICSMYILHPFDVATDFGRRMRQLHVEYFWLQISVFVKETTYDILTTLQQRSSRQYPQLIFFGKFFQ